MTTSLESVMISGRKFTFSFKTFPLPPPLALVLSMVKIRPETPRFRCCTCKKEKGVKMISRVEKQMTSTVHSDYFLYCKFRFDSIFWILNVFASSDTKPKYLGLFFFLILTQIPLFQNEVKRSST